MPITDLDRPFLQTTSHKFISIRSSPAHKHLLLCSLKLTSRSPSSLWGLSMATEEVNKPSSLPPYPELIFEAIDALKQKEGSNKTLISNFIESTYGDLPAGHVNLLTYHLNKLKESGDLVFVKNNYMRPDPNPSLKRGRGRPPKAKDQSAIETQDAVPAQSPAPAPAQAPAEAGSEIKRGRGRPKKDPNAPSASKKVKVSSVGGSTGRPRGRPRKVQPELAGVEAN